MCTLFSATIRVVFCNHIFLLATLLLFFFWEKNSYKNRNKSKWFAFKIIIAKDLHTRKTKSNPIQN